MLQDLRYALRSFLSTPGLTAVLVLTLVALAAMVAPAQRAVRVDPTTTLRSE